MNKTLCFAASLILATVGPVVVPNLASAETHEIKMVNRDPDDKKRRNVFIPNLLKIKPGDTVRFVSVDKGHNTESIKGMIPDGADKWKSKLSKDFEVTFETPGVYGYKCTPHLTLGMVGVVVVEGDNWDANLDAAKVIKQRGKAKKEFEAIWSALEESR